MADRGAPGAGRRPGGRSARSVRALAAAGALLLAAACGTAGGPTAASETEACPEPPEPAAPPRRVVTMDGGSAAILHALGVGDRVVGTAAPDFFDAFDGRERAELDRIPVIDEGRGNREAVVAAEPDLVMGVHMFQFGAFDGTPTVHELSGAGIGVLVSCSPPGPVSDLREAEAFIEDAAEVFGVPERGAELVERIERDAGRVPGGRPVRVLALSAPPGPGQPIGTMGGTSLANGIIARAGGENIAGGAGGDLARISAEQVAAADPEALVVLTGFSPMPEEELVAAVRASPLLSRGTAVRDGRIAVLPQSVALSPSVLNGRAVADLADVLHAPAR
ncbi:ABC transporter substrate-binding protein [Nocardiopsis potens]|uniref:ABC transporter substrate-binding protein n=1 Tax=Nocardiopsis potens TaxID=1246458 RepID=UPI00034B5EBA|nr:ABC transporter substrate-binding protein [Nocardiopsis potens]